MACPIVSAGRLAVISVCDAERPNQAEILSRPSVAASVATVNMNSTSRVVRIKPKYFDFPPTWACIVVIWAGVGLRVALAQACADLGEALHDFHWIGGPAAWGLRSARSQVARLWHRSPAGQVLAAGATPERLAAAGPCQLPPSDWWKS